MNKFFGTITSAICTATAATTAATGDNITAFVTLLIGIAITATNAGIEIYRKIRDRDADIKGDKKDNEK